MERYIIATIKSWNIENSKKLIRKHPECDITLIRDRAELSARLLEEKRPKYVFFPHWSWVIPECIYRNYICVIFHMTDLPFGRGGSPLQNLLVRGIYKTKISAIKAEAGMDTGPVYLKESMDISEGNADDILRRASHIVFDKMIPRFLTEEMVPHAQAGEPVIFKRRIPGQSEIPDGMTQRELYDYIRMLDGEGYPAAYQRTMTGKVYYRNARIKNDIVFADAEFRRNE